ncbi:MAG: sigma-70 family RNA polymerase sigma factor [Gammaproteobacteria bacterium]
MRNTFEADERRWAQWMTRAQAGDVADYERLLRELARVIETYIVVRFGRLDVLEDCVQECLVAIHAARHTWDPRRPFRPWLFTLVRHRTIDQLRVRSSWLNAQRDAPLPPDGESERLLRVVDGVRILARLAPDHREMITLAKYGGLTAAEAAAWLGISESAAKARLHRALGAIQKLLESEGLPA